MIGLPEIIFFVGSHGTGKTQTLQQLDLRYRLGNRQKGTHIIDGVPRNLKVMSPFPDIPKEAQQYAILFEYLRRLGMSSEQLLTTVIYTTNCAMRFLGYAYADVLDRDCIEILEIVAKLESKIAHSVFYFPIEVPLTPDLHRPNQLEYQKVVDQNIKDCFDRLKINYRTISGNILQKVEKIAGILDLVPVY